MPAPVTTTDSPSLPVRRFATLREQRNSSGGGSFVVRDHATGRVLASCPWADELERPAAFLVARAADTAWTTTPAAACGCCPS